MFFFHFLFSLVITKNHFPLCFIFSIIWEIVKATKCKQGGIFVIIDINSIVLFLRRIIVFFCIQILKTFRIIVVFFIFYGRSSLYQSIYLTFMQVVYDANKLAKLVKKKKKLKNWLVYYQNKLERTSKRPEIKVFKYKLIFPPKFIITI